MRYEVGQKVTTPHGDGVIISMSEMDNEYEVEYPYKELTTSYFGIESLQPYRTPHEKLIEMGYWCEEKRDVKIYRREDKISSVRVYDDNTISCNDIDLELSRILTDYLEELAK